MDAAPLKLEPKYGYFPWWPEDGDAWIHPDDVARARTMIPSARIFRRDGAAGDYMVLHYGEVTLRVRPTLWREVVPEEFDMGGWVEVLSRGMINAPRVGTIREMVWDPRARAIRYQIAENGQPIEQLYSRDDLRLTDPIV